MIDILIPTRSMTGYQAHQFVTERLDTLGIATEQRDYLFCVDPIQTGRIILRTKHEVAAILGKVRELPEIATDRYFDFCVRVSPMKSVSRWKKEPENDLIRWREKHLNTRGIEIQKAFTKATTAECQKRNISFTVPDVIIVGRLKVTDPNKVMTVMQEGVGRHRAYGFGLLQLFPV